MQIMGSGKSEIWRPKEEFILLSEVQRHSGNQISSAVVGGPQCFS